MKVNTCRFHYSFLSKLRDKAREAESDKVPKFEKLVNVGDNWK